MKAYHVHIQGQVQGVGFRPYVYRLANELRLCGWANNGTDGVHVEIEGDARAVTMFLHALVRNVPATARITHHVAFEIPVKNYRAFVIKSSEEEGVPDLLLTPDLAMCDDCKKEMLDSNNRRYGYAFTTCTQCGPRYSMINTTPYDRVNTTMRPFGMCEQCREEYESPASRRFFSQTNSCPACAITLSLCEKSGKVITQRTEEIVSRVVQYLNAGQIIAAKALGGYLLLCDARNKDAIETLRARKHRPAKPLALLYASIDAVRNDAHLSAAEEKMLTSEVAPIVLLNVMPKPGFAWRSVAPQLNDVGVMLPSTPVLYLIAHAFGHPLIATSGNNSGSPICYDDEKAFEHLGSIADYFITNNREIVVPEDDSVVRFTPEDTKIVLRRSRGMAPAFLPHPFRSQSETWLAMGSDLKSVFALLHRQNVYASQYLGDLQSFETQQGFVHTLDHWQHLLKCQPQQIVVDRHPDYFSSTMGRQMALQMGIPVVAVQHHRAHFASVLAENDLLTSAEPVLGVVWDGTGWGDDGNNWGGEFFVFESDGMERVTHLDYFQNILGDKMAKEPRLSALSLCRNVEGADILLRSKFTNVEWKLYNQLLAQPNGIRTSSIGRLFDGVASLLGLSDHTSYEGEAALNLEALAWKGIGQNELPRSRWISGKDLSLQSAIKHLVDEIRLGTPKEIIAFHFHRSLVNWIARVAMRQNINRLAFSGGVFQNALLVHLIQQHLGDRYELFFHQQLAPNDECLSVGQLAWCYAQANFKKSQSINRYALHLN